jgi:hypothetical protein
MYGTKSLRSENPVGYGNKLFALYQGTTLVRLSLTERRTRGCVPACRDRRDDNFVWER